jgi:hypothetical protein
MLQNYSIISTKTIKNLNKERQKRIGKDKDMKDEA